MALQFKVVRVNACGTSCSSSNRNAPWPWINTGLTVATDERITLLATGKIHLYAPASGSAMNWTGPQGCVTNASCGLFLPQLLLNTGVTGATLLAYIGSSPSYATPGFGVGRFYDIPAPSAGTLYLTINDYADTQVAYNDNRGYFDVLIVVGAPGEPIHNAPCP